MYVYMRHSRVTMLLHSPPLPEVQTSSEVRAIAYHTIYLSTNSSAHAPKQTVSTSTAQSTTNIKSQLARKQDHT